MCGRACKVVVAMLVSLPWAALPAAGAEASKGVQELLAIRLQATGRDTPEWNALMAEGRKRADFCFRCHGPDGTSVMPLVPNLAGQNPYYLLEQLEKFSDGRRQDYIMTPLARQFSREDKVAVVFYFSNQRPRAESAASGLVRQGEVLYGQRCTGCHGPGAHGSDKYARLAGQNPAYLKRRLTGFRDATGGAASVMTEMARTLTEKDTDAVTAYLSTLP